MPVFNKFFLPAPGTVGAAALQQGGPLFSVEISVPSPLEQQLRQSGQAIPPPERGMALLDTGATISAVDDGVIRKLGVSPIGLTTTGTAGGPAQQNLYPARFLFPELTFGVEFNRALGANLGGLGIIA